MAHRPGSWRTRSWLAASSACCPRTHHGRSGMSLFFGVFGCSPSIDGAAALLWRCLPTSAKFWCTRGQGGPIGGGVIGVVESDHADVARNRPAMLVEAAHHAQGHLVVGGENGCRRLVAWP